MIVTIEKENWIVDDNEFIKINHNEYCYLLLYNDLANFERLLGFFKNLQTNFSLESIYFFYPTHGGFLPINCAKFFNKVFIIYNEETNLNNIKENISNFKFENIVITQVCDIPFSNSLVIDFSGNFDRYLLINSPFLITNQNLSITDEKLDFTPKIKYDYSFNLWQTSYFLHFNNSIYDKFINFYKFFIKGNIVNFDNLINLCIMVKNAGPQFRDMLLNNLSLIDEWTILDTGSSDETIDIINEVLVGKKKGHLYQEPFINFRDSRNRLLDLAGDNCKYTLMLDDTYNVKLDLREFLYDIRSDQFADSYTLFIKSDDSEYGSNRILKSNRKLRYINKIHEVINDKNNINVIIPINRSFILDERYDYMEKRTMERKELDLKLLFEELEEDPNNSRTYYYLGQTFNLMEDFENAFKWLKLRVEYPNAGFLQEKVDAAFEMARCANFKLNKPWNECEKLYLQAYELDKSRPDSIYFIGIHYFLENNMKLAHTYFKKAYKIGYPIHCQYSLKPTLSYHFCPKFLTKTCYINEDYKLGEEVALFYLKHNSKNLDNTYYEIDSWYKIYQQLNIYNGNKANHNLDKPIFCLIIDGGFKPWNGSSILNEGVGGSETWAIETARWINRTGQYRVFVFCKCSEEENFEGVQYFKLEKMYQFINNFNIEQCFISRFSEYIPLVYNSNCQNIHFIIHDILPSGIVIPINNKLKNIFCLTHWHRNYFIQRFPDLEFMTSVYNYGINHDIFHKEKQKKKYNFIYSSTANRGLLPLLLIWPKLFEIQPLISLDIYCDLENKWVNNVAPEQILEIKKLLIEYSTMNINYHGWVDKETLAEAWAKADIWFYPCIFQETFCLTALESAISQTLAITNGLGSLIDTVGQRGICLPGDPLNSDWQNNVVETIKKYLDDSPEKQILIQNNYNWAKNLSWENQTNKFLSIIKKIDLNNINQQIINKKLIENTHFHIIKIGAHIGSKYIDNLYGELSKNTKILLVEPIPILFEKLKNNLDNQYPENNFILENIAIRNYSGKTKIFYPSMTNTLPEWTNQCASINKNHLKEHNFSEIDLDEYWVRTKTLNQLIDEYEITGIEYLILDTEGCDYEILTSFNFIIKPKFIKFENKHIDGVNKKGIKYLNLLEFLFDKNYKVIDNNNFDTLLELIN